MTERHLSKTVIYVLAVLLLANRTYQNTATQEVFSTFELYSSQLTEIYSSTNQPTQTSSEVTPTLGLYTFNTSLPLSITSTKTELTDVSSLESSKISSSQFDLSSFSPSSVLTNSVLTSSVLTSSVLTSSVLAAFTTSLSETATSLHLFLTSSLTSPTSTIEPPTTNNFSVTSIPTSKSTPEPLSSSFQFSSSATVTQTQVSTQMSYSSSLASLAFSSISDLFSNTGSALNTLGSTSQTVSVTTGSTSQTVSVTTGSTSQTVSGTTGSTSEAMQSTLGSISQTFTTLSPSSTPELNSLSPISETVLNSHLAPSTYTAQSTQTYFTSFDPSTSIKNMATSSISSLVSSIEPSTSDTFTGFSTTDLTTTSISDIVSTLTSTFIPQDPTSNPPANATISDAISQQNVKLHGEVTDLQGQVKSLTIALAVIAAILGVVLLAIIIFIFVKKFGGKKPTENPDDFLDRKNQKSYFRPQTVYELADRRDNVYRNSTYARKSSDLSPPEDELNSFNRNGFGAGNRGFHNIELDED